MESLVPSFQRASSLGGFQSRVVPRLWPGKGSAKVRAVSLPRLFLLVLALGSLTGCGYNKFRSTNYRGETLAEWTSRGFYYPVTGGYRIKAIERISGEPYAQVSRYPYGRMATVTGPNIVKWRVDRPAWLDQEYVSVETENETIIYSKD